jgi:D-alanine-D-alanine ligase-like ATP-grasp enzyme
MFELIVKEEYRFVVLPVRMVSVLVVVPVGFIYFTKSTVILPDIAESHDSLAFVKTTLLIG